METFNVPRDLLESIQDVIGRGTTITMASMVQYEVKADRLDNRVLVLTDCRVLLISSKIPCRVEQSSSFINILSIESKASTKLTIALEGRRLNFTIPDEAKIDRLIIHIIESLALAFPKVPIDQLIGRIEVVPATRQFYQLLRDARGKQEKRDPGPCGGFSSTYRFMCDYHNFPIMADVVWDIDTIYMSQDCRELRLADFDHLDSRYLVPIVTALEYNHWFKSINANNLKLHSDVINSIPSVMRKNSAIEQLNLSGIGVKSEFIQRLSEVVMANPSTCLVHIDLSGNVIGDQGASHLSECITHLPKGLIHLNLSSTSLTAKGVNKLAEGLCANSQVVGTLRELQLARNTLKAEDVTNLFNFLAQPNALVSLDLSGTECALDLIFGALLRGSCQKLEHLDLSHNPFLAKKATTVQQSCKQFFGSVLALKSVNLANCRLPRDAIKYVLLGLGSNPIAKDIDLNLSSNSLGQEVATLEICIPDISNITTLDLSDNGLEMSLLSLIPKLAKNRSVRKLYLGRNFVNVKQRNMSQILDFLTEMIHDEGSCLESLSLAGSRLRGLTNIFLNALGGNSSLKEIDISGNQMGDAGARMLAKALQINTTLHTLQWDNNGTTALGLTDVAEAMEKNYTVKKMPLPLSDVMNAMKTNREKTEAAVQKIESCLQRNHSPQKFASDQGYRLQQGFLINTLQQMLDRSIVSLQATAEKLETKNDGSDEVLEDLSQSTFLCKDAASTRQLLGKFQDVALKSETEDSAISRQLKNVSAELQDALEKQIKTNVEAMMLCGTEECPTLLEDEDLSKSVHSSSQEKSKLPRMFTDTLVMDQLGADIFNKLGEVNLTVATHMSDQLIEGVLRALNANHDRLLSHLRSLRASERDETDDTRTSAVLRKKPSEDELNALDILAISNTKRKSVYSRKVRPQSSLGPDIQDTSVSDPHHHDNDDDLSITGVPAVTTTPTGKMEARLPSIPSSEKTPEKPDENSPVPAPRKRKSALLKTAQSMETTPGETPLAIVHEKGASSRTEKKPAEIKTGGSPGYQGNMTVISTVEDDEDEDGEDSEEEEEDRAASVDSLSRTDSTDVTDDGSSVSTPPTSRGSTPSHGSPIRSSPLRSKQAAPKKPVSKADTKALEAVTNDAPRLEHLAKSRPRPPRTRAVTRTGGRTDTPGGTNDGGLEPSHEDLGGFFDTQPVVAKVVKPAGVVPATITADSKHADKKKGWSPGKGLSGMFKSRSQSAKSPSSPTKVPLSSPNRLPEVTEVKPDPKVTARSHSPDNELDKTKSEDEKEDEPVEEPRRRVPGMRPGGLGMGPPAGMGGMLAEMQAKRASMNPLASKTRPARPPEPRETTLKAPPPSTVSPIKAPPGGRPLFPPDHAKAGLKPAVQHTRAASPQGGEEGAIKPKPVPLRPRPPRVMPKPTSSRLSTSPKPGNRPEAPSSTAPAPATTAPSTTDTTDAKPAEPVKAPPVEAPKAAEQGKTGDSSKTDSKPNSTAAAPKQAQLTRGFSEAVEETDNKPAQPARSTGESGSASPDASIRKRMSVREKAAALDKNRNVCERAPSSDGPAKVIGDLSSKFNRGSGSGLSENRSSVSSSRSSVDGDTDQSAGKKGAEPKSSSQSEGTNTADRQSNGSTKGESKEEFLLYL